ncbi:MAG: TIR domain-containing protein [Candidatus Tectomicrobia bacterium]|nr:TIR domain-containing protein [Candidatus Tectomicrobia bacterium]
MRHVFFSFDWDDVWRVNQSRFSWVSKGSYTEAGFVDEAEIETLKRSTDAAIRRWIDDQLYGTSVTCVMIRSRTAYSKWVRYEIQQSINKGNGLVGIYIHNMKDSYGLMSYAGKDPFSEPPFNFRPASYLVYPCCSYYDWVRDNGHWNLGDWIERAAQQAGR